MFAFEHMLVQVCITYIIHCALTCQVAWKSLFKVSSRDHGTLYNFSSLLGRVPKAKDPKTDLHACMDTLLTVFKGDVVSAACDVLGIEKPSAELPDRSPHKQTVAEQNKFLEGVASKVISLLPLDEIIMGEKIKDSGDRVFNYGIVLCHFACLVLELTDAWGEGDGERVLRCWRVLLVFFQSLDKVCFRGSTTSVPVGYSPATSCSPFDVGKICQWE